MNSSINYLIDILKYLDFKLIIKEEGIIVYQKMIGEEVMAHVEYYKTINVYGYCNYDNNKVQRENSLSYEDLIKVLNTDFKHELRKYKIYKMLSI